MSWIYRDTEVSNLSDIPEGVLGFIYLIINEDTKEYYIGRKNLYSQRTLPPLKGTKRKRKVTKESDWLRYQSSNITVKQWNSPMKEIIEYCYTKKMLTYRELQAIVCMNGLEDPKCMNDNVLGKFYSGDFKKGSISSEQ